MPFFSFSTLDRVLKIHTSQKTNDGMCVIGRGIFKLSSTVGPRENYFVSITIRPLREGECFNQ